MARKFFQIGFNKCGTTSFALFFARNGIPCVHWDEGRLAQRMQRNLRGGEYILSGYEDYDAFTDMEHVTDREIVEGYKFYREIAEQVEDARFILNTRDRDRWIKSRLSHTSPTGDSYVEKYKSIHGLDDTAAAVELWKKDWDAHHAAVQEAIPPGKLLVFNVEADPPERLCDFIGLDASAAQHFMLQNVTMSGFGEFLLERTPKRVKRTTPRKIKETIKRWVRKRR